MTTSEGKFLVKKCIAVVDTSSLLISLIYLFGDYDKFEKLWHFYTYACIHPVFALLSTCITIFISAHNDGEDISSTHTTEFYTE